jgi:hypothetical protein
VIDAVSDLLKLLPGNGVGSTVARDTWHPESGKFWVITKVQSKDKGVSEHDALVSSLRHSALLAQKNGHFDAFGHLFYHGRQISEEKRIASVWKWGWYAKGGSLPGVEPAQGSLSGLAPSSSFSAGEVASTSTKEGQ